MLAGIEYGTGLSNERAQAAIRAMTDDMRHDAVYWIWNYISSPQDKLDKEPKGGWPDRLWEDNVRPWLSKAWPHDHNLRTRQTSEAFALIAVTTDSSFPDAVKFVSPFLVPCDTMQVVELLGKSNHPDDYPAETLSLLQRTIDQDALWYVKETLELFERIAEARPALRTQAFFRSITERLRRFSRTQ
jgi:hypothetical protein